jgi:BCD family chlorophyll transporter-like MFS transporter
MGRRRSPYILIGLLMCVAGLALSPYAAFTFETNSGLGLILCILAFGLWGMGFNFATVSYFSLASELSGEQGRSRTVAIMFFFMIVSIIFTAIALSRMLDPYSPEVLIRSFWIIAGISLGLGLIGLIGLEDRHVEKANAGAPVDPLASSDRHSWGTTFNALTQNRQALLFFVYLILMLAAILGQDNLLEPFAGSAFNLSVSQTTHITSIWGTFTLVCLIVAGLLEGRVNKRLIVSIGSWGAVIAFGLIIISGFIGNKNVFYTGVSVLGLATGLATVSNLSLMLDMTTAGRVGAFIGAWGMADALARLVGNLLSGVVRDLVTHASNNVVLGYTTVFGLEALMLIASLIILRSINVGEFQSGAAPEQPSVIERAAMAME